MLAHCCAARHATANAVIRYSDSFPDPIVLLSECIRLGLEGIVCKRKDALYRSGARSGWIKVKTEQWKAANQYSAKLFEKSRKTRALGSLDLGDT